MILERELKQVFQPKYSKTDFRTALENGGFAIKQTQIFKDIRKYTIEQYLMLLQSYSVWNDVPEAERQRMLRILKRHFLKKQKHGFIIDTRDIEVIVAG